VDSKCLAWWIANVVYSIHDSFPKLGRFDSCTAIRLQKNFRFSENEPVLPARQFPFLRKRTTKSNPGNISGPCLIFRELRRSWRHFLILDEMFGTTRTIRTKCHAFIYSFSYVTMRLTCRHIYYIHFPVSTSISLDSSSHSAILSGTRHFRIVHTIFVKQYGYSIYKYRKCRYDSRTSHSTSRLLLIFENSCAVFGWFSLSEQASLDIRK